MMGGRYGRGGFRRQRNAPRNYFTWNPAFDPAARPAQGEAVPSHDRLDPKLLTGSIELKIQLLSPVFVGSGTYGDDTGQPRKMPTISGGRLVIPGSSIKGICRLTFEALTGSLSPWGEPQVDLREARKHYRPDKTLSPKGRDFEKIAKNEARRQQEHTGYAASVFGSFGRRGRISFDDALAPESVRPCPIKVSVPYPPAGKLPWKKLVVAKTNKLPGPARLGRRFYGRQKPGGSQPKKIPVLALPSGIEVATLLRLRNLHHHELGLVLLALGVGGRFTPKLGGAKYDHGVGWVRFHVERMRLRKSLGAIEPWIDGADEVREFCNTCLQQATRRLDNHGKELLERLSQEMQVPNDELGGGR